MAILLASTMAVSMAACGSSSSGSDAGAGSSGGGGDKTISVAIWDPNQLDGLQQIADEWGAESGYTVDFTVPGWDGYWTMLEAGVSGGEMPDVFWMHSNNAEKYMGSGVLMNLDSYIENDDSVDLNNYFEGITDLYTHDGSVYALPKDHDTIAVVYNKAIFDKYGIAYPTDDWTWRNLQPPPRKSPIRARTTAFTEHTATPAATRIHGTTSSIPTAEKSSPKTRPLLDMMNRQRSKL